MREEDGEKEEEEGGRWPKTSIYDEASFCCPSFDGQGAGKEAAFWREMMRRTSLGQRQSVLPLVVYGTGSQRRSELAGAEEGAGGRGEGRGEEEEAEETKEDKVGGRHAPAGGEGTGGRASPCHACRCAPGALSQHRLRGHARDGN